MRDDPRIDIIICELIALRHDYTLNQSEIDASLRTLKKHPRMYASFEKAATNIIRKIERYVKPEQQSLAIDTDPQARIDRIWEAVEHFGKQ